MEILTLFNFIDSFFTVDCSWGSWSSYSSCSKICGGGLKTKKREKIILEQYGGLCSGQKTFDTACNTQECPGEFYVLRVLMYLNKDTRDLRGLATDNFYPQ